MGSEFRAFEQRVLDFLNSPAATPAPMSAEKQDELHALRRLIECAEILDKRPRPMCRDCADEDGTCPSGGLDCDMRKLFATVKSLYNRLASLPSAGAPVSGAEQAPSLLDELRAAKVPAGGIPAWKNHETGEAIHAHKDGCRLTTSPEFSSCVCFLPALPIKTWKERCEDGPYDKYTVDQCFDYARAEIADLRAALATAMRQQQGEKGGA